MTCASCGQPFTPRSWRRDTQRFCSDKCVRKSRQGGLTFDKHLGRWLVMCRDQSKVYYHRALMMGHLGRWLGPDEVVHHINGDKTDDRLENLQVMSLQEHGRLHARERPKFSGWALRHAACIQCGTTERRHFGRGLCDRCYWQVRKARSEVEA